jgi:hypothetical protein
MSEARFTALLHDQLMIISSLLLPKHKNLLVGDASH